MYPTLKHTHISGTFDYPDAPLSVFVGAFFALPVLVLALIVRRPMPVIMFWAAP
jgi:hypothetical protein